MHKIEFNEIEAEMAMAEKEWLDEKVVGSFDSAEYVFWTNGGYNAFYEKWVWMKLFPEKYGLVVPKWKKLAQQSSNGFRKQSVRWDDI